MDGMITAIIIAIISLMGNVMQFIFNKKSSDIKTINDQVKLLGKLQEEQTKAYEREKNLQDKELEGLRKKLDEQDRQIKADGEEIQKLQCMVSRLIGQGCHLDNCPNRSPYTVDEINEMTKKKQK